MGGIVAIFSARKFGLVGFHQARQEKAKIKSQVDRACSAKIFDSPNDTGRTDVEAGITVLYALIERMGGPEPLTVAMFQSVRRNFLNRQRRFARAPRQRQQRYVAGLINHD